MQEALRPSAPFWREHGYFSPAQGYFSYLLDLTTDPHSQSNPPRLAVEAVIRKALFPLAVQAFPEVAQATTAGKCVRACVCACIP